MVVAMTFDYTLTKPIFKDKLEERQHVKERLALAYRIMAREGLCEGASGHLTTRDPIERHCFWVNPYGLHFSRMTASDLLLVDYSGNVVAGGRPGKQKYNAAAVVIHSAIHAARPDVDSAVHAHSPAGKAFSALGRLLPMYTQDAAYFYQDHSLYASNGGVVLDKAESSNIVRSLGHNKAVILQNHGILTVGGSIESALAWFYLLEKECSCALLAEAAAAMSGIKPIELDPKVAQYTWEQTGMEEAGRHEMVSFFDLVEYECRGAHRA